MKRTFSVTQINSYIHRIFESDYALKKIYIKGEVSNCKYHSSGHIYFTLKDEKSSLRCVMFASARPGGLHFRLENGQMILAGGRISVYERDGSYQLYAYDIELSGAGMLYVKYEQLKKELSELGYFDFDIKKELPAFPEKIGIVTALTGAAIEDIKSIARRRNPYVQLYLYPAKVQGDGAAASIVKGIRYFDKAGVDIIIIGRGGGSIEDLWAFNERVVADAIHEAITPVISGTGHEIDMTIADYCADVRAATPSAACELAIPVISQIEEQITAYEEAMNGLLYEKLQTMRQGMELRHRLLEASHPETKLLEQRMLFDQKRTKLHQSMETRLMKMRHRVQLSAQQLTAFSPSVRLQGGYVFAQDVKGKPISSVTQLHPKDRIHLILSDGQAETEIIKTKESDDYGEN